MAGSDFYDVQLTPEAEEITGGQARHLGEHLDYTFTSGETTRVLTSEWKRILSKLNVDGVPMLMIAPTVVPAPPEAASTKATKGGK